MSSKEIISKLRKTLIKQENIVFAYLFGSFVTSERHRDIDVAIHTKGKMALLEFGELQTELSKSTGLDIDLIRINNLPGENPVLAFEIVSNGSLLFTKESGMHLDFKEKVLLRYFDTAVLRKQIHNAFEVRMNSNQFGKRNYASREVTTT